MSLTPGLNLPFGIQPVNPVPVDSWSGPYSASTEIAAVSLANSSITPAIRFQSMEVRILFSGIGKKYWYKDGIADVDLVEFSSNGGGSSLSLSGGTVTGTTTFSQGLSASTLSGGTIYSGSTDLYGIFQPIGFSTSGSGTSNYVAKWTGSTALGDSSIYDNGTSVGVGTGASAITATLTIKGTGTTAGNYALSVTDSANRPLFRIGDDGTTIFNTVGSVNATLLPNGAFSTQGVYSFFGGYAGSIEATYIGASSDIMTTAGHGYFFNNSGLNGIVGDGSNQIRYVAISGSHNFTRGSVNMSEGLTSTSTSLEQLKLYYDNSNYFSTTVGSAGSVTFNSVGGGSNFRFSDKVEIAGSSDANQLTIFANTTQSNANPLIMLKSSGGTSLMSIHSDHPNDIFIGLLSGNINSSGHQNIFIGNSTGQLNTTGLDNTIVGHSSFGNNDSGAGNCAFGRDSLAFNNGSNNQAFGFGALKNNSSGSDNIGIGKEALLNVTTGSQNTGIGYRTGVNINGSRNIFIGYKAGYEETSSDDNLYISSRTYGSEASERSNSIIYGVMGASSTSQSLNLNAIVQINNTTVNQLKIAYDTSNYFTTTVGSTGGVTYDAVGVGAGFQFNDQVFNYGSGGIPTNTAFGQGALTSNTTGYANSAFGKDAMKVNVDGYSNAAFGYLSMQGVTSGLENVAIGNATLYALSTSYGNTAVGHLSLKTTNGVYNTGIGYSSLFNNNANSNTALGAFAGYNNSSGERNIFIGDGAGYYETGSDKFIVANTWWTGEADGRTNSLLYGIMGATPSVQSLNFNAIVQINNTTVNQLKIAYDTSNYYTTTVGSAGAVTFNAVGAGRQFNFNQAVYSPYLQVTADNPQVAFYDTYSNPATRNYDINTSYGVFGNFAITKSLTQGGNPQGKAIFEISAGEDIKIGTDLMSISSGGKVFVDDTNNTTISGRQTLMVASNDSFAIDKGGMVGFAGRYSSSGTLRLAFSAIAGRKENSTDGNPQGYMEFSTYKNGVGLTEAMRISSTQNVGINTTSPSTKLHISGSSGSFRLEDGTQSAGYVLTSDSNGVGVWAPSSASGSTSGGTSANLWSASTGTNSIIANNSTGNVVTGNYSSILAGSGNTLSGTNSAIIGGSSISGNSNNTVYVPYLNISFLGTGTSINNLGIDSSGNIVTGTTGGGGGSFLPLSGGTVTGNVAIVGQLSTTIPSAFTPTASITIDWNSSNIQTISLASVTGASLTLVFSNPVIGAQYILKIIQHPSSAKTLAYPTMKWEGGTPLVPTTSASAIDLITMVYDGTNYLASYGTNFS